MLAWQNNLQDINKHQLTIMGLRLVLLITIIATFVPFSPEMPLPYLDPSWKFGINQGIHQGLSIGTDIIFTYGPYASIFTKSYHPATDLMMVGGSLYLALCYWLMLVFLMKDAPYFWIVASLLCFPVLLFSEDQLISLFLRDVLLFSLPLLLGLLVFKMTYAETPLILSKSPPLSVAWLFIPLGLLPLIKGSIMILCCVVIVLCAALFWVNKEKSLAANCLATPLLSMLVFWLVSGQPISNLPNYFSNMGPIVSGFSGAMAKDGNIWEVILYLLAASVFLLVLATQRGVNNTGKLFLVCLYGIFLFIAFKAGFVRHDSHAITAGLSLLIAVLLLRSVASDNILPSVLFSVFAWCYIDSYHLNTSTGSLFENTQSTYSSMWRGIKNRLTNKDWPKLEFDKTIATLQKQASFPLLPGTTDIYSYDQSLLIASGNSWSPRPIFQSYSAYTPVLAEKNRAHLIGTQAPDNIIFRAEPIDGRMAALEDGASWPIIMANYQPFHRQNDFLFLRKKANITQFEDLPILTNEQHRLGEWVKLPNSDQALFAKIVVSPTLLGKLAHILYKPSHLQILLELHNGMKIPFRFIAGMAEAGFVISPLIENTTDFEALLIKQSLLDGKKVKSISITQPDGNFEFWKSQFMITVSQIQAPGLADVSKNNPP